MTPMAPAPAMSGRTRLAVAMARGQPDRVPVMCQLALGHYLLNLSTEVSPAELWFTSEGFAHALVTLQRRYRFSGILVNLPGRDPGWRRDVARIERTAEGEVVHWRNGDRSICPADDNVHHFPAVERPRPTIEEVDPDLVYYDDPHAVGGLKYPYYYGLAPAPFDPSHHFPEYLGRTIALVRELAGPEVAVHGEVFSPFTQLAELFGYAEMLLYLLDQPERCRAILQAYTRGTIACALLQARAGADVVLISSAFAGGGFISPGHYRQFVLPYERQIAAALHAAGVTVYTHTCGAIGDRLEAMVETGTDGLDCLDPPPLGTVTLPDAKRRLGGRAFIKGNLDAVNVLLLGGVEQVRRVATETLRAGKPGGGYILSSACSVAPRVPPENVAVLHEVAEAEGWYPAAPDSSSS